MDFWHTTIILNRIFPLMLSSILGCKPYFKRLISLLSKKMIVTTPLYYEVFLEIGFLALLK